MSVTLVDVDATWVHGGVTYDAGELRRADAALVASAGVLRSSDDALSVSVDGSDVVTVQPGSWVVPGDAVAGSGVWRGGIAAAVTGNLEARDATNGRIDVVVARQLDTDTVPTHGAYTGRIEIVTGAPSATPGIPDLPDMMVELARITVPASGAGAASVDSSHRAYATAAGGEIVAPTASALPTDVATGQAGYALDTGTTYRFDGAAWQPGTSDAPELELRLSADQNVPNATMTDITNWTAARNVGGMWSSGKTVTISKPGLYALGVTAQWAGAGNGGVAVGILVNGTPVRWQGGADFVNNELNQKSVEIVKRLATNDAVTFQVEQNSGNAITLETTAGGGAGTAASVYWLRS